MKRNILSVPIQKVDGDGISAAQDLVAVEEPLEILLNDRNVAITMRTPGNDEELAAGFLFGLVRGAGYEAAGRLGALAAAEVIQHIGARPQVSLKELAKANGLPV